MKKLVKWLTKPLYSKYQELLFRVSNLETAVDCLIETPEYIASDDYGFNGQRYRKKIFKDLLKELNFNLIIETGTWIGNTTGYMAENSNLQVYSCEINKRFHSLAKLRLKHLDNISLTLDDSISFLKKLSNTDLIMQKAFFYLDAHWYEQLPLAAEIEIIANNWKDFVIMIDDFQVPGDEGYGYDNYGGDNSLTLQTFSGIFARHNLIPFFPNLPSAQETGFRRGCVVLSRKGKNSQKLNQISSLSPKGSHEASLQKGQAKG